MMESDTIYYLKSKLMDTGLLCQGPDDEENDEEFNRISSKTQTSLRRLPRAAPPAPPSLSGQHSWVVTLSSELEDAKEPSDHPPPADFVLEQKGGHHKLVSTFATLAPPPRHVAVQVELELCGRPAGCTKAHAEYVVL